MAITIKDNVGKNIRGDFIRFEGNLSGLDADISNNTGENIGGNMISMIDYDGMRKTFPELQAVADRDFAKAAAAVSGKPYQGALDALQAIAAFSTISLATLGQLLPALGWTP